MVALLALTTIRRRYLGRMLFGLIVLASASAVAQEQGDAKRGEQVARDTCAACHAVVKGRASTNPLAPPFAAIASSEGMTAIALNVALQTAHREMPNIMLERQERSDVIAYILSLKGQ